MKRRRSENGVGVLCCWAGCQAQRFYMNNAIIGFDRIELLAGFQDCVLSNICKSWYNLSHG